MINLDDYFSSPINDEEKQFIGKIILDINQIHDDTISSSDALLLLKIRNKVFEKVKERGLDSTTVDLNNVIAKLVEDEIVNLSNDFNQFRNKKDQVLKFVQYIFSMKGLK